MKSLSGYQLRFLQTFSANSIRHQLRLPEDFSQLENRYTSFRPRGGAPSWRLLIVVFSYKQNMVAEERQNLNY
jgi:hypothetical protein